MERIKAMFSSKIYHLRKQKNLTQEQAAELLNASPRGFQKWEEGDTFPDFLHILFLVYHFNFDLQAFVQDVFSEDFLQSEEGQFLA